MRSDGLLYLAILVVMFPACAWLIGTCVQILEDLWKGKGNDEDPTDP